MANRYIILQETCVPMKGNWQLCLQWGYFTYANRTPAEYGYRFIHRRDNGDLNPVRGQARIATLSDAQCLINQANKLGWGSFRAEDFNGSSALPKVRA